jgi:hypothetical protein
MKALRKSLIVLVMSAAVVVGLVATAAQAQGGKPEVKSADAFGIVWDHGNAGGHAKPQKNTPNMTYHGGPVQIGTTEVHPIFWGTSWQGYTGDEINGIDTFYASVGGSSYAGTNTEYTNSSGAHVSPLVHENTIRVDNDAAPSGPPSTNAILAEVAKEFPTPDAGAYYPVYIDQPRGNAGYCAWHSSGTINGTPVQFAFFFKLDGDPGCDPGAPYYDHSQGLAALGNVSGHELSEMLTDPQLNAWFDSSGNENADKCAWTFSGNPILFGTGGSQSSWKIQGNWSNAAYIKGSGYTRGGCIDGT